MASIEIISTRKRDSREVEYDPWYRYMRHDLRVQVTKKGTTFENLDECAHDLRVESVILFKYICLSLGSSGTFAKRRLTGQFRSVDWDGLIQNFVDEFKACSKCDGVGTALRAKVGNKKKGSKKGSRCCYIRCYDCGARTYASDHRLWNYIARTVALSSKPPKPSSPSDKPEEKTEDESALSQLEGWSISPFEQTLEHLSWSPQESVPISAISDAINEAGGRRDLHIDLCRFVINQAGRDTARRDSELAELMQAGLIDPAVCDQFSY